MALVISSYSLRGKVANKVKINNKVIIIITSKQITIIIRIIVQYSYEA